jgi:hypothetical protein
MTTTPTPASMPEPKATPASEAVSTPHAGVPDDDRKPLYAIAGAAEVAVSALRELPARVTAAMDDERRAALRARLRELPAELKAIREDIPDFVLQAQERASDMPERVRELVSQGSREAAKTYDELASRGHDTVRRLRGEYGPAVDDAVAAVRGRMADAAEGIAAAAEKAADGLHRKR